jgi:uncharacterized protein YndB with AHSA1/START domain
MTNPDTTDRAEPIGTFPDRHTFRLEIHYPHPPSLVWRAITQPEALETWFMAMDIEPHVGGTVSLKHTSRPGIDRAYGVVSAFDIESVFEYRFPDAGREQWPESILRFELIPDAGGCTLVFTQTLAPDALVREDWAHLQIAGPGTLAPGTCGGWEGFFREGLERFLERRPAPLYNDTDDALMEERGHRYEQIVRAQLM